MDPSLILPDEKRAYAADNISGKFVASSGHLCGLKMLTRLTVHSRYRVIDCHMPDKLGLISLFTLL